MRIEIDDGKKKEKDNKTIDTLISVSEKIGEIIISKKDISLNKEKIKNTIGGIRPEKTKEKEKERLERREERKKLHDIKNKYKPVRKLLNSMIIDTFFRRDFGMCIDLLFAKRYLYPTDEIKKERIQKKKRRIKLPVFVEKMHDTNIDSEKRIKTIIGFGVIFAIVATIIFIIISILSGIITTISEEFGFLGGLLMFLIGFGTIFMIVLIYLVTNKIND